jgi:hypothetical protein
LVLENWSAMVALQAGQRGNEMNIDLEIDLDDGGGIVKSERIERKKVPSFQQPKAQVIVVQITKIPMAIVISYARVSCLGCGSEHKDHRGIFIDNKLSNGVRAMQRVSLRELPAYSGLPRRVDEAPRETIPICSDCWPDEGAYRTAVASAQVEGEPPLFGEPDKPKPVAEIAQALSIKLEGEEG